MIFGVLESLALTHDSALGFRAPELGNHRAPRVSAMSGKAVTSVSDPKLSELSASSAESAFS